MLRCVHDNDKISEYKITKITKLYYKFSLGFSNNLWLTTTKFTNYCVTVLHLTIKRHVKRSKRRTETFQKNQQVYFDGNVCFAEVLQLKLPMWPYVLSVDELS